MKVKKLDKFQDKMGLKGCKWSSLNAPFPISNLFALLLPLRVQTANCSRRPSPLILVRIRLDAERDEAVAGKNAQTQTELNE